MKPLATLLSFVVVLALLVPSAQADRKSREEEKAQQQRLERQLRDVEYILKHESDGTLSDRKAALNVMISTGVAPDEAYWQAGYIKRGDEWVSIQDRWLTPEQEQKLEEYNKARSNTIDTDEGHYQLALWCAENGFDVQAYGHLKAVLLNNPDRADLRQLLGYQRIGARWMNADDYATAVRETERLAKELQEWGPEVAEIRAGLHSHDSRQQIQAKARLLEIKEASAVPVLELLLLFDSEVGSRLCVEQLCRIDHRRSSIALCKAAIFLPETAREMRSTAIGELKTRPLEHFVPVLLGKMQTPITIKYSPFTSSGWEYSQGPFQLPVKYHQFISASGVNLEVNSETAFEKRSRHLAVITQAAILHWDMYHNNGEVAAPVFWEMVQNSTWSQSSSVPKIVFNNEQDNEYSNRAASDRLLEYHRKIDHENRSIEEWNDRVSQLLGEITDQSRNESPEFWWYWWKNRIEVETDQKQNRNIQEVTEIVNVIHIPASCFTAGTPVWTDLGPQPIEQLKVGDMALTKDVETGELMYRPIIRTTTRKPKPLVTIDLGAEQITSTGGHPFFVAGEGWVRARELKAGQILHTPTGTIKIDSVTETPEDETYNLVVDGFHTYFVGMSQVLVHDVSITSPTDAIVPGLLNR